MCIRDRTGSPRSPSAWRSRSSRSEEPRRAAPDRPEPLVRHAAEEAAAFYVSVFGGESRLTQVTRYTEAGPGPAGTVMTVELELDGQRSIAINGGPRFTFDEAVSFPTDCE